MHSKTKYKIRRFVVAIATLLDGIAATLTLGFWWPNLSFKAVAWQQTNALKETILKSGV